MSDVDFDCLCDFSPAEFQSARLSVARKAYQCEECTTGIAAGEEYQRVSGKWEGSFMTIRTCTRCLNIYIWVQRNIPCFCYSFGNMIEDARMTIDAAMHRAPAETEGLREEFEGLLCSAQASAIGRLH